MLTEEIQQYARALGETLRENPAVQTYLQTQANCSADAEAVELENRLLSLYQELLGRQQRGEALLRSEIDAFNALKSQVHQHPLIQGRDIALGMVKQSFKEIAAALDFPLGMEFAALALAGNG